MGLGDYQTALRMRDLLKALVGAEVESQRPRLQYATVQTIDRNIRKCGVKFPGESGTVSVNMGALQPSAIGQTVRIDGLSGDRFIADVMGPAYIEAKNTDGTRQAVVAMTTVNITLSGLQTVDGVVLAAGDRVLVKSQTSLSQNGIYVAAIGTWVRASDADTADKLNIRAPYIVTSGTAGKFRTYVQTETVVTIGTSNIEFHRLTNVEQVGAFTYPGPRVSGHMVYDANNSALSVWDGISWTVMNNITICTSSTRPTFTREEHMIYETDTKRFGILSSGVWIYGETMDRINMLGTLNTTNFSGRGWVQHRFMENAREVLRGGGVRLCTSTGVSWSHRFMVMNAGKDANTATAGNFEITMPPDGTVITRYASSGTATVASGIIPLAVWESLYYELPLVAGSASVNANFRIVGYSGSSFDIPPNWILICARSDSSDTYCSEYMWGDGQQDDYWRALTLQNSWSNYGTGYYTAEYRKVNGVVYIHGLIRLGTTTAATVLTTLPVGFRPATGIIFPQIAGGNSVAATEIEAGGSLKVRLCSNNGYMSIECSYQAAS